MSATWTIAMHLEKEKCELYVMMSRKGQVGELLVERLVPARL